MAELHSSPRRAHALEGLYVPGRHGRAVPVPGVRIQLIHPVSIVWIAAKPGKSRALASALKAEFGLSLPAIGQSVSGGGVRLCWCGPEQYFAIAQAMGEGELFSRLKASAGVAAALAEQSHGRVMLRLQGPFAREVLARGTGLDVHATRFPKNSSAMTSMAHVGVHLVAEGGDAFILSVFRGFAESFFEWLAAQAAPCGYELR